jgi:galactose mutarotase-like enzyme
MTAVQQRVVGRAVRLESADLRVDVLPDNGGRIASIRCLRTGTEFLLSGSDYAARAAFPSDVPFELSDCAGWDECLPTVSRSTSASGAHDAADHGDLWRCAWRTLERSSSHLVLSTRCFKHPFTFTRSLQLNGTNIRLDYTVSNNGDQPDSFLYACHPLFAVDPGDHVLLPKEIAAVRLHFSLGDRIGTSGEELRWPLTVPGSAATAINRVGDIADRTAEMLYVPSLAHGACALHRKKRRQAVLMRFTTDTLPSLGLWICNGGWPELKGAHPQYAVAMEPTVAPFGALSEAVAANAAPVLQPGADYRFSIELEILGCQQPCSLDEIETRLNQAFTLASAIV